MTILFTKVATMSSITSSIWHTKKEKPTEDKTIFAQHKSFRDGCIDYFLWEKQEFTEAIRKDVIAWTYLDDLLVCEQELIRTRKALDVAVDALKLLNSEGKRTRILGLISITDTALDKIKTALEQKEHFADASKKIEQKDVK